MRCVFVVTTILIFTLNACSLFKSEEDKAIELVQLSKRTETLSSITWLEYENERAKEDVNTKYVWESEKTGEEGIFIVSFQDSSGGGHQWEVILKEKIVRLINGNDYLSMKYNISRYDPEKLFEVSNITTDTLKVEGAKLQQGFWESVFSNPKYKKIVVYQFQADIKNNTDKYITSATINGELKLIFKEKTIIGGSSTSSFKSSISKSKPWAPGEIKHISIKTKDIDRVYLNYIPDYTVFELNLEAEDPIGFSYDKNIWEVDLSHKWKEFTSSIKQIKKTDG